MRQRERRERERERERRDRKKDKEKRHELWSSSENKFFGHDCKFFCILRTVLIHFSN